MSNIELNNIAFDLPKNKSNVIKVIGVGGGGSNAVNHMFSKGINGVDFIVCNTDAQALANSPVPNKIQLGVNLTEGLGAGANPEIGEEAAKESIDDVRNMLDKRTKMLFITVGMGGGTGTGAAPVIAKIAREMEILTVGIVTIPFEFEGRTRKEQARKGIDKLREHVDSLVVINNNKLREVYGNLGFKAGFSKADEVLSTAATGIAQVITHHYTQNIDLKDARTVLSNSGTAIMGSAVASGTNRAREVITKALDSPLLNDNKIIGAKRVLLLIVSGVNEVTIDEIGEINDYIQSEAKTNVDIIMGVGEDERLEDKISVTVIATGFSANYQKGIEEESIGRKKVVHVLEEDEKPETQVKKEPVIDPMQTPLSDERNVQNQTAPEEKIVHHIIEDADDDSATDTRDEFNIFDATSEPADQQIELTLDLNEHEEHSAITDVRDIEVVDMEVVKPEKEEPIRYSLDLEDEFSEEINVLKNVKDDVPVDEELQFELKVEQNEPEAVPESKIPEKKVVSHPDIDDEDEISPLNQTIEELKKQSDKRKQRLKDFNYKFISRVDQNIDEFENQPAYKRMGVDINDTVSSSDSPVKSRLSLDVNEDDDIRFRSNNSFLHDNVD